MVYGPLSTLDREGYGRSRPRSGRTPQRAAEDWARVHWPTSPFDLWRAVAHAGWEVHLRPLRALEGGVEAYTVPSEKCGFTFVVDPRVTDTATVEFRLAHEVGHTLFYRPGHPPTRSRPPSLAEEAFCDAFAAALLAF